MIKKDLFIICDDYKLDGYLTSFESYIFSTTDNQLQKQHSFENCYIYNNKNSYSMLDIKDRKKALTEFNKIAEEMIGDHSKNTNKYSCILVDFKKSKYDDEVKECFSFLKDALIEFATTNSRAFTITCHFDQIDRPPHCHILIQKKPRITNEFQKYLINKLNNE